MRATQFLLATAALAILATTGCQSNQGLASNKEGGWTTSMKERFARAPWSKKSKAPASAIATSPQLPSANAVPGAPTAYPGMPSQYAANSGTIAPPIATYHQPTARRRPARLTLRLLRQAFTAATPQHPRAAILVVPRPAKWRPNLATTIRPIPARPARPMRPPVMPRLIVPVHLLPTSTPREVTPANQVHLRPTLALARPVLIRAPPKVVRPTHAIAKAPAHGTPTHRLVTGTDRAATATRPQIRRLRPMPRRSPKTQHLVCRRRYLADRVTGPVPVTGAPPVVRHLPARHTALARPATAAPAIRRRVPVILPAAIPRRRPPMVVRPRRITLKDRPVVPLLPAVPTGQLVPR